MKPIDFDERNLVIAKDQPQYIPIPAYRQLGTKDFDHEGKVVFCMGLSFKERLRILFTGKIWCQVLTFNRTLHPTRFSTQKWDVLNKEFFKDDSKPSTAY